MHLFLEYVGFGLVSASILALAAVGFTLQYGVTNVLNLAFGQVMTLGALAAYGVNVVGGDVWEMVVAGGLCGAAASVALNRVVISPFARRGLRLFGMIVVTLSLSIIMGNVALIVFGFGTFSYSLSTSSSNVLGMTFTGDQLETMALAVAGMVGIRLLLQRTRLGRAMRATSTDPILARACGMNTQLIADVAWAISGVLCGVAGVTEAISVSAFSVTTGDGLLLTIVAAAIVGGIGQPYGAMLGAVLIGVVTSLVGGYANPTYTDLTAFVILVVFLVFRPVGLARGVVSERGVLA